MSPAPQGRPNGAPADGLLWVGHSTVLVDLDGTRVLTDPALGDRVSFLRRRAPAVDPAHRAGIDAVLVSHQHFDHLDLPSLRQVGLGTPLVVPRGGGGLLRRRGFRRVTEVEAGGEVRVGTLRVRATPAEHPGARFPVGPLPGVGAPALGYVLEGSKRLYFAGDTGPFDGMSEIGRPPLDVALLPVGGWGPLAPAWERLPFGVPSHLDPRRAAEALRPLGPAVAVPIHWGTYAPAALGRLGAGPSGGPARAFRRHAAELAPGVEVRVLNPGEDLRLGAVHPGGA